MTNGSSGKWFTTLKILHFNKNTYFKKILIK